MVPGRAPLSMATSGKMTGLPFDTPSPTVTAGVRRFIDQGEQARFVPELPLKLVIIDETIVMFGMQDPIAASTMELTMMVVEHPSLARVLTTAFDAYWAQGLTFEQAGARPVGAASSSAWSRFGARPDQHEFRIG